MIRLGARPGLDHAQQAVAFAIARLPGRGGHVPAHGLDPSPTEPIELPGVILAAIAGIGLGAVVGPEAPLIALGGGLGFFAIRRLRADAPPETQALVAACGTFAAVSFLPGFELTPAVAIGLCAGVAAVLRLPLSAVVLATLLTGQSGLGVAPLIIVGSSSPISSPT